MHTISTMLVTLGALLLTSRIARAGSQKLHVPQVTLLILFGVALGPLALDLLPAVQREWYPVVAEVTLAMVGFLLGSEFAVDNLRRHGRAVLAVSVVVTVVTFAVVFAGLFAMGLPPAGALVLASAATATDPAACQSVVRESRAAGPTTRTLLGVVAVDDLWGILLFSGVLALLPSDGHEASSVATGLTEVGGSVLLGVVMGGAMAVLTGRLQPGRPSPEEALGFVLLAAGLADRFQLSYLLTAVVMGAVVANAAKHHEHTFREIEDIEWPFLVIFFILSGSSVAADGVRGVGVYAAAYVALRVLGRLGGGALGIRLGKLTTPGGRWFGLGLLPQAGVALGMTLVAAERMPDIGQQLLTVVVLGTIAFEVVGPILTRILLTRSGESGAA